MRVGFAYFHDTNFLWQIGTSKNNQGARHDDHPLASKHAVKYSKFLELSSDVARDEEKRGRTELIPSRQAESEALSRDRRQQWAGRNARQQREPSVRQRQRAVMN